MTRIDINSMGVYSNHSYDILGAGMLWKPKKSIKFVKIRAEECFDNVQNEECHH